MHEATDDAPDLSTACSFLNSALRSRKVHVDSVAAMHWRDCDLLVAWDAIECRGNVLLTAWSVDYARVNDDVDSHELTIAEALDLAYRIETEGENPVDVARLVGQMRAKEAA